MCGIIAVKGKIKVEKLIGLLNEAQIRGKHATGVARWDFKTNKIEAIVEPIASKQFTQKYIKELELWTNTNNLVLIGHTRYSTSDLRFNQPIFDDTLALAHNGVVSQEDPSKWIYKCKTANDSELLFRYIKKHSNLDNIEQSFKGLSYATVWIQNGQLNAKRNGLRPLYCYKNEEVEIYASTKDILDRVGFKESTQVDCDYGKDFQLVNKFKKGDNRND